MDNRHSSHSGVGLVLLMVMIALGISTVCRGQNPTPTRTWKIEQGQAALIPIEPALCRDQVVVVFETNYFCRPDNRVLIGVHMAQKPGSYRVMSYGDSAQQSVAIIEVEAVDWPRVRQRPPRLRTAGAVTRSLERAEIGQALSDGRKRHPYQFLVAPLERPLKHMEETGAFGRIRVFSDDWIDQHKGQDLRAAVGTEVMSIGDGFVMTAKHYSSEGNLIVLYHGDGVYSLYLHLDELFIREGQRVLSGQVIATSGDTGNSGGPHLHWAVYVNQKKVDPNTFIDNANWQLTAQLLRR